MCFNMDRHWHPQLSTLNFGLFFCTDLFHQNLQMFACMNNGLTTLVVQSCYYIAGYETKLWPLCNAGDDAGQVWAQWNHSKHSWGWTGDKGGLENNTTHYPYCEWRIFIGIDYCSVISPLPYYSSLVYRPCVCRLQYEILAWARSSGDTCRRTCFYVYKNVCCVAKYGVRSWNKSRTYNRL